MKKLLSMFLALIMIFTSIPTGVISFAEDETSTGSNLNLFEEFTLGRWPQSVVEKAELIEELNGMEVDLKSYGFTHGVQAVVQTGKAYTGLVDFKYADFNYQGERYRKVVFNSLRPTKVNGALKSGTGIYYFKWEPIIWTVCKNDNNEIFAITQRVIDAQPYTYEFEGSNWSDSFICKWLNNIFYSEAFTSSEMLKLSAFNKYGSDDYLVIPSSADIEQGGMLNNYLNIGYAEGYSVLMNSNLSSSKFPNQKMCWSIAENDGNGSRYVDIFGDIRSQTSNDLTVWGIRPVIKINNSAVLPGSEGAENYKESDHTHLYTRSVICKEALASNKNCIDNTPSGYYHTCLFCDSCGGEVFVNDKETNFHTPEKIQSDEAFKEYSAQSKYIGIYYYTCSTCGEVLKGRNASTFSKEIEHEHDLLIQTSTPPSCTKAGVRTFSCVYNCGYNQTREYGEALGHFPTKIVKDSAFYYQNSDGQAVYYYSCARCGEIYKDLTFSYNPEHEHEYVKAETTYPTCDRAGEEVYRCKECGVIGYRYGVVEAIGHNYRAMTNNKPSCTESVSNTLICQNCADVYNQTIYPTGHDFELSDKLYQEATCKEDALYYYICKNCGQMAEEYYRAPQTTIPHNYSKIISDEALCTPGTDTTQPTYYYTCSMCKTVIKDLPGYETRTFSAGILDHEHSFSVVSRKEPTCLSNGNVVYECTGCDYTYKEVLPKLGHEPGEIAETFEATCTKKGYIKYNCLRCGIIYKVTTSPALEHDFSVKGEIVNEATCTNDTEVELLCSRCGLQKGTLSIPDTALGHDLVLEKTTEATCSDGALEHYKCSRCNYTEVKEISEPTGAHKYVLDEILPASCVRPATHIYCCEYCGEYIEDTFGTALGHDFAEISRTEPTCTANGRVELVCKRCNERKTQTIKADGHRFELVQSVEASCSLPGFSVYICSVCSAENRVENSAPTGEHKYNLIGSSEATCTERGKHIYKCEYCNKIKEDEFGTALGHNYLPGSEAVNDCVIGDMVVFECSRCGDTYVQSYPPLGHDYSVKTDVLLKPVSCVNHNIYALACSRCGEVSDSLEHSYEDDTPYLKHEYYKAETDEALCTPETESEPATYYYSCKNCKTVIKDLEGYENKIFAATVLNHEHKLIITGSKEPTCIASGYNRLECENCLYKTRETIKALGHQKGELINRFDADCEQPEREIYKCERCSKEFEIKLSNPLGHDYTVPFSEVSEANCTENAKYYMKCSRCGVVDGVNIVEIQNTALGHNYELVKTVEASCTEDGYKEFKCTRCGDTFTEKTDESTGLHSYVCISLTEPTCTKDGLKIYECKKCLKTLEITIKATGHNYIQSSHTEPTCTLSGETVNTCSNCGDIQVIGLSALGHSFVLSKVNEPDCTSKGTNIYICSRCSENKIEEFGEAKGHTFILNSKTDATCTEQGKYLYVCNECGSQKIVIIPAKEHNYVLTETKEPDCKHQGVRIFTCLNCQETKNEYFGEPTEHNFVLNSVTNPGCTENGEKVFICSICGENKTEIIPASGHSFKVTRTIEPDCAHTGKVIYTCENCGEEKEETYSAPLNHDYVLISKTEATCPNNGVYVYECSYCGDRQTEVIPAKGHDFSAHSITVLEKATCEHGNIYYGKCTRCGLLNDIETYEDVSSKLKHIYSKVKSNAAKRTDATSDTPASYYFTCELCGIVIKDLEGYENRFFFDDTVHTHNYALIRIDEASCSKPAVKYYKCEGCGGEYQVLSGSALGHSKGEIIEQISPDCTSSGHIKYSCARCGELINEVTSAPLGHNFSKISDILYREASCEENALYYSMCSRCSTIGTNVIEKPKSAFGHSPEKRISSEAIRTIGSDGQPATYYFTCSRCDKVLDASFGYFTKEYTGLKLSDYSAGSQIEFGRWPQTLVRDNSLISILKTQPVTMFDYGFAYHEPDTGSTDDLAYKNAKLKASVRIKYGDIIYGTDKYRKVVLTDARVGNDSTLNSQISARLSGTYFFKWEPVKWTVLENEDDRTELIANIVLDSTYNYLENYEFYLDDEWSLNSVFGQLAFSESEKQALFYETESVYIPDYEYIKDYKSDIISDISGSLNAKYSDYAMLLSSQAVSMSEESNFFGSYLVSNVRSVINNSDKFYGFVSETGLDTNYFNKAGYALRPQVSLKSSFIPTKSDIVQNYALAHTHSFTRRALLPQALKQEPNCFESAQYYYCCDCCGLISDDSFFEFDHSQIGHLASQVISDAALKKAASDNNDAQYYYTCSRCGEVLKETKYGFFVQKGTHLGEHRYAVDKAQSTGGCESIGVIVYKCTICGETYTREVTEIAGHQWERYSSTYRAGETATENVTYYPVYKCSVCGELWTDKENYYEITCESGYQYHKFINRVGYTAPTCTKEGQEVLQCKFCEVTNTVKLSPLGHDYSSTDKNGFTILTPATCGHDAVYNYSCVRCGALDEKTFVDEASALTHNFSKKVMSTNTLRTAETQSNSATYYYTCILCGEIDKRFNHYFSPATYQPNFRNTLEINKEISFGAWPQSKVTDNELISELEKISVNLTSYGYKYTPSYGMYYQDIEMYYADVNYNGERYRKVVIGTYRPFYLYEAPLVSNSYQKLNSYKIGTYWFKWEPLSWKVLSMDNDKATLITSDIIDAQIYTDDYNKANNITWAESTVRKWLNESFYESAFNDEEKTDILSDTTINLDNPYYGTKGGEDTLDKVRLISFEDIQNRTLSIYNSNLRIAKCSDYSISQGIKISGIKTADWMTRSPSVSQKGIVTVENDGNVSNSHISSEQISGVRAVISLSLAKGNRSADVNDDGGIDISDISLLLANFSMKTDESNEKLDLNENAYIESSDLSIMLLEENYGNAS